MNGVGVEGERGHTEEWGPREADPVSRAQAVDAECDPPGRLSQCLGP